MCLQWDGRQGSREKKPQRLKTGEPYRSLPNSEKGTGVRNRSQTLDRPTPTQWAGELARVGQANYPRHRARTGVLQPRRAARECSLTPYLPAATRGVIELLQGAEPCQIPAGESLPTGRHRRSLSGRVLPSGG